MPCRLSAAVLGSWCRCGWLSRNLFESSGELMKTMSDFVQGLLNHGVSRNWMNEEASVSASEYRCLRSSCRSTSSNVDKQNLSVLCLLAL